MDIDTYFKQTNSPSSRRRWRQNAGLGQSGKQLTDDQR